jgi:hypothetical protein
MLLSTSTDEPALSASQQQRLSSIEKQLKVKGNERKAGAALRAAVAPSL